MILFARFAIDIAITGLIRFLRVSPNFNAALEHLEIDPAVRSVAAYSALSCGCKNSQREEEQLAEMPSLTQVSKVA